MKEEGPKSDDRHLSARVRAKWLMEGATERCCCRCISAQRIGDAVSQQVYACNAIAYKEFN